MSDIDGAIALPAGGAMVLAFFKLVHWIGTLWATISREKVAADRDLAAQARANDTRIADQQSAAISHLAAQVSDHTTRDLAAWTEVKSAVVGLVTKIDTIASWQERTPTPEGDQRPSLASERRKKVAKQ